MIFLFIVLAILIILALLYNNIVQARNRVQEAWSDIDVQLKRRYDLIPNLIETVKGYASHEKTVFENVTAARSMAQSAAGLVAKQAAEDKLSGAIRGIFAVAENYPDLKANQNFLQLQGDLTDTEDKIQAARRFYNGNVRDFNTKIQIFPTNLFASSFGFTRQEFFGIENDTERMTPKVSF